MHIQRALEQLGYPHNEITVYLSMLKMGEGTISDIARESDMPRSTTQLVVSDLQKKGLVSLCQKRQHQVWIAENPSRFLTELHEKEALMKKLLPDLQAIQHESKNRPVLKYYNGRSNISLLFDHIKQSLYPIKIIGSVDELSKHLSYDIVQEFLKDIFGKTVPVQLISNDSDFVQQLRTLGASGRGRLRVCTDEHLLKVTYIVFDSEVVIILLNPVESIAIHFYDEGMALSTNMFFDRVWEDL